ncbi:hypothetical protein [Massilia agilis]
MKRTLAARRINAGDREPAYLDSSEPLTFVEFCDGRNIGDSRLAFQLRYPYARVNRVGVSAGR